MRKKDDGRTSTSDELSTLHIAISWTVADPSANASATVPVLVFDDFLVGVQLYEHRCGFALLVQMSRKADRAFNQACVNSAYDSRGPTPPTGSEAKAKEESTPAVPDEIKRILDAWEKKDYFGLLQLPGPTVDDLGNFMLLGGADAWGCMGRCMRGGVWTISTLFHLNQVG